MLYGFANKDSLHKRLCSLFQREKASRGTHEVLLYLDFVSEGSRRCSCSIEESYQEPGQTRNAIYYGLHVSL